MISLNEESKSKYTGGSVLNGLHGWTGSDEEYFKKAFAGVEYDLLTVDEARKILNQSLGDKCLSDYVRQDRDE